MFNIFGMMRKLNEEENNIQSDNVRKKYLVSDMEKAQVENLRKMIYQSVYYM
jgi:hypothetical protein